MPGAGDGQGAVRHVVGDRGTGGGYSVFAHGDRGDQVGVAAQKRAVSDHGAVLFLAVKVRGRAAAAKIHVLPHFGVAHIAQVRAFCAGVHRAVFDLHKVAQVHVFPDHAVVADVGKRAGVGAVFHGRIGQFGVVKRHMVAHGGILDVGVRADHAAAADHRFADQNGVRQNRGVVSDHHVGADQHAVGRRDVHAADHVAVQNVALHDVVQRVQLLAVVRAKRYLGVFHHIGAHVAAFSDQDLQAVGQVVFVLHVVVCNVSSA